MRKINFVFSQRYFAREIRGAPRAESIQKIRLVEPNRFYFAGIVGDSCFNYDKTPPETSPQFYIANNALHGHLLARLKLGDR